MIMSEVAKLGLQERFGPVILSEASDLPYEAMQFRRMWRKVATAAGIPKEVKNMDSRDKEAAN